jgi:hypothetical protein
MGVENLQNLTNDEQTQAEKPQRPSDEVVQSQMHAELQAEREEHDRRTAGTGVGSTAGRYDSTGPHAQ